MFTATNERVQCSITIESQQFNNNQPSAIDRIKISTRPIFTKPDKIMEKLFSDSIKTVFTRYTEMEDMETISQQFSEGMNVTTGESLPSEDYA